MFVYSMTKEAVEVADTKEEEEEEEEEEKRSGFMEEEDGTVCASDSGTFVFQRVSFGLANVKCVTGWLLFNRSLSTGPCFVKMCSVQTAPARHIAGMSGPEAPEITKDDEALDKDEPAFQEDDSELPVVLESPDGTEIVDVPRPCLKV